MGDLSRALPPQAPERGRLARLLGPFHVTGVFWYRFHLWGVQIAPRWSLPIIIWLFTLFFFLTLRRIRSAIATNLAQVLGGTGWIATQGRIWRTMHTFAWCLTERYEHLAKARTPHVELDNTEAWDAVVGRGTGFVVLTAHIGSWEVASAGLSKELGRLVHLVREEEVVPEAQLFVRELLERHFAGRVATHFAGDPALGLALREALGRGEIVALQGDRPRAGGRTIDATLFGRAWRLPIGPLVLARVTGLPLLPVFAFREGRWRYRVAFRDAVLVAQTAERDRDLALAAQAVASAFEWAITRAPHQWFCFREAWPAR